jgi:hypothetical protein
MSTLCRVFGHRVPDYLRINRSVTYVGTAADTGTHCYEVRQPCKRYGANFPVAYVYASGTQPPKLT